MTPEDIKLLQEIKKKRQAEREELNRREFDRSINPFGGVFGEGDRLLYKSKYGQEAYDDALLTEKMFKRERKKLEESLTEDSLIEGTIRSNGELADKDSDYAAEVQEAMRAFQLTLAQAIALVNANRKNRQ